jgi:hypothetical protein
MTSVESELLLLLGLGLAMRGKLLDGGLQLRGTLFATDIKFREKRNHLRDLVLHRTQPIAQRFAGLVELVLLVDFLLRSLVRRRKSLLRGLDIGLRLLLHLFQSGGRIEQDRLLALPSVFEVLGLIDRFHPLFESGPQLDMLLRDGLRVTDDTQGQKYERSESALGKDQNHRVRQ